MTRRLTLADVAPRLSRAQTAAPPRRVIVVTSRRSFDVPTYRSARR